MSQPANLTKKCCYLFGFLFLISIPVVWLSLTEVNFEGDLTRISKLSEKDFSWKSNQHYIDETLRQTASIDNADVLVIGDSFSASLIWQTQLNKHGNKVATYHWDNIGLICEDWIEKVKNSGFNGKKIYFEIVEIGLEDKLNLSLGCSKSKNLQNPIIASNRRLEQKPSLKSEINLTGQYLIGIQSIFNSYVINNFPDSWKILNKRSKSGTLAYIPNGCDMFSNKLCNLGLFYHQDYTKKILTSDLIFLMETLEMRLPGYDIVWIIVPNKSTVYHRLDGENFWNQLEKKGKGPNLLKHFLIAKNEIIDFYKPNDTHLSTNGYLHLGQVIQQWKSH